MSNTENRFGRFFRTRRIALGLSLSEFARRNKFDKGNISRLERGLVKPPESANLLRHYADALGLQKDTEDWKTFMRHAAMPRGKISYALSNERAADVEEMLVRLSRRLHDSWVKARDLEQWSLTLDAQSALPELVRRLVYASTERSARIVMPGGEGIQRRGWDGMVETETRSPFVPAGVSAWEISVQQRPADKAEREFNKRSKGPLGRPASEVTFVFVTSRKWERKEYWRDEKQALGRWKNVEVYDSSDLEHWLELASGVDAWIAERLQRRPAGVIAVSDYWEALSRLCAPALERTVFLASRRKAAEELRRFLLGPPGTMAIECRSPIEAVDFVVAYLAEAKSGENDFTMEEHEWIRTQSRTIVVKDQTQWDALSRADGQLNLLPFPSLSLGPEELNLAVSRGHRVVIANTQFAHHQAPPLALPRPSRYELEAALRKSGFDRERAAKAARVAGGSLTVLKRHVSQTPDPRVPGWHNERDLRTAFLPMLLAGAWDAANEVDRRVLSDLAGRRYDELEGFAAQLLLVDDPPLIRIESRWRLVSPEDAWSLAGAQVTDDLLTAFEKIAIDVLGKHNDSDDASVDERIQVSARGESPSRASSQLCRGVAETVAILGSGYRPIAKMSRAQGLAIQIVRVLLHKATWHKWASLDRLLPLLAEAAPDEFLGAIEADLRRKNPALAVVLDDRGPPHPLLSSCRHAGLLWALEGLAWSPELLPRVCTLLAKLDKVDKGRKYLNRPIASLCEILLPWRPQTAAGVDGRIDVMRHLARREPDAAWKLARAMMPQAMSDSMPSRRPVWRDWLSDWQEGVSRADCWKQVDAAADLIVDLIGNDPERWSQTFDALHWIPEIQRKRLIDRLQSFPSGQISADERRRLADNLRKIIQRHGDSAGTRWALPEATIDTLKQALARFVPSEGPEQYAWLFVPWPRLEGFRDRYEEMEKEIRRRRAQAMQRTIDRDGIEGLLRFADFVESPDQVGAALADADLVASEEILPDLLTSSNKKHQLLAGAYVRVRIRRDGWDWARSLPLEQWSKRDAGAFLAQVSLDPVGWDLAESLGEDVARAYWQNVLAYSGSRLDRQQLELACQRLIDAGRPEAAVGLFSFVSPGDVSVSPSLVMDVLTACRDRKRSHPGAEFSRTTLETIVELFGWLQRPETSGNDELTRRLRQLEWEYLSLLDGFGASPESLSRCLSEDPQFFAQLIASTYPSKDEEASGKEPTEEQRKMAIHGYRLLTSWGQTREDGGLPRVPGTQSDRSIDEPQLLRWLQSARSQCRDSGRLEFADLRIGEMLASWPQPEDANTMWPPEQICEAIEEADSDDLDEGFQIGALNSRGVTSRSPLEGGDLERKEAVKYRKWAELCRGEWPRTAGALRRIAESYDFQAQREDSESQERAQQRT